MYAVIEFILSQSDRNIVFSIRELYEQTRFESQRYYRSSPINDKQTCQISFTKENSTEKMNKEVKTETSGKLLIAKLFDEFKGDDSLVDVLDLKQILNKMLKKGTV